MQGNISRWLKKIMDLLFILLNDSNISIDVKIITIVAIGDICLMTENDFHPYFEQAMDLLIQAGQQSIQPINPHLPPEEQQCFHELRQAIVDSFVSIINGIKSPQTENQPIGDLASQNISNMFFYIESLMGLGDLKITIDLAKQILDLYSDILLLQQNDNSRNTQNF